jgi:RadC-like JAB domain
MASVQRACGIWETGGAILGLGNSGSVPELTSGRRAVGDGAAKRPLDLVNPPQLPRRRKPEQHPRLMNSVHRPQLPRIHPRVITREHHRLLRHRAPPRRPVPPGRTPRAAIAHTAVSSEAPVADTPPSVSPTVRDASGATCRSSAGLSLRSDRTSSGESAPRGASTCSTSPRASTWTPQRRSSSSSGGRIGPEYAAARIATSRAAVSSSCRMAAAGFPAQRDQEVMGAPFLDLRHRLLGEQEIFRGTLHRAAVEPRKILKQCLLRAAGGVVRYSLWRRIAAESGHALMQITRDRARSARGHRRALN